MTPARRNSPVEAGRDDTPELTFIEHLEELRTRLIICISALVVCTIIGFFVSNYVINILTQPLKKAAYRRPAQPLHIKVDSQGHLLLEQPLSKEDIKKLSRFQMVFEFEEAPGQQFNFGPDYRSQFYYFSPLDPLVLRIKASIIAGIILALPILLWQLWLFVSPGLTRKEKHYTFPLMFMGLGLFPLGCAFAYFFLRFALGLLSRYAMPGLEPRLEIFRYLNFVLTMMIATGAIFEVPMVILFLTRIGVVSTAMLRRYRAYAIIGIFIITAMLTPPDVVTQVVMAIPLIFLYELSIWLARPIEKRG